LKSFLLYTLLSKSHTCNEASREQTNLKFLYIVKYNKGNLELQIWNLPIELPNNVISPKEKKHALTKHGPSRTWKNGNPITNVSPFPPKDKKDKIHMKGHSLPTKTWWEGPNKSPTKQTLLACKIPAPTTHYAIS
jgi:hypothetical protein